MGYCTRFELEINEGFELLERIIDGNEELSCTFDTDGTSHDSYKWYNHESVMKEVSKEYPKILFTLKGEGEDPGDIWFKYFKNGKIQRCQAKITFDEYDESKLVDE
jgi:hypothetical protein